MASDPAPPSVILAIPVPSPPSNPPSPSSNPDSPSPASVSGCTSSALAPQPRSSSAPASSPAIQAQCTDLSRRVLPADLLCFQSFLPPSSSVEPSPVHLFPAAPEPPPAAPPASVATTASAFPPLPTSQHLPPADAHLPGQPAVPQLRPYPVCRNDIAASVAEPPPPSSAPVPPVAPPSSPAPPSSTPPPLPSSLHECPPLADAPLSAQPADPQLRPQPVRQNVKANPHQPKSYAQAAKGSPGPGFVRAHARDVDSFARLPRTGIKVICGSHDGIPACSIVPSDLPKVEGLYAKALIMKFHGGRPSLAASHKEISSWGFESPFSIGPLTSRSFLLRFQEERDLLKILTRPSSTLINFPYKIFRWHNRCHMKEESCMVPIWISLPRLPLQCFAPEYLESFASLIGRFLCLDKATATLARPSEARMCIELDLRKERPKFIWIDLFEGFKQPIVYERVPKFCSVCHVQGHTNVDCSKASLDTLQNTDSGPCSALQERPQSVRQNAKNSSAVVPQVNPNQSRASSAAATAANLSASSSPQQDPPDPSHHQLHPPPRQSPASSFAAATDSLSASDLPQQNPPRSSFAAASSEQQRCDTLPLPPSSPHLAFPAAAENMPAVQPSLQSTVAAVSHMTAPSQSSFVVTTQQPLPSLPAVAKAAASSCPSAAVTPTAQDQGPSAAIPHLATEHPPSSGTPPSPSNPVLIAASQQLPAVHPYLQSNVDSVQHPPSSEVQLSVSSSGTVSAPAAVPSSALFLSAQAAPFSPSDPVQSVQQTSALNNQHSTSSLRVYYNKNGAKYITSLPQPGRPWEMVNCQLGNQGHLSSITNATSLSYNHHQIHALEGYDSEGSFETDSQPNSPLESTKEDANKCSFLPQSCASEGEQPTEDHPGFQGHISDVEFYHRPMSSKKNKRQPDGPLRVQLRTRKGPSGHK